MTKFPRRTFLAALGLAAAGCTAAPPAAATSPTGAAAARPQTTTVPRPSRAAATSQPAPTAAEAPRPVGWQSRLLTATAVGALTYRDAGGLRLPDFGAVGYRGGAALPKISAVRTIGPAAGDNTARIQRAIDEVSAQALRPDGFRGAVQLQPGAYHVSGTITIRASGVALRGSGDGSDPATNTILRAVGNTPAGRDVIRVGRGGTWDGVAAGTGTAIMSETVPVGSTAVRLAATRSLRPGMSVVITHPCSAAWLAAVHGGDTMGAPPWQVGSVPIQYLRTITAVAGSAVTLNAPLYNALDRRLSSARLYVWNEASLIENVGVARLRIDIASRGDTDEDHAATGIKLSNVRDAWVDTCTILHFTKAGVMTLGATRTTIASCRALSPASRVAAGRRYSFDAEARSQQVLFTDCHAQAGRHSFIANGAGTASGIVFHRTTATGSFTSSEGHRKWSQGLLFDGHQEIDPKSDRAILLGDRGDYGTSHGWAAVNSVAWNCDPAGAAIVVQQPPTAQNYAIGCAGTVNGAGPFTAPVGYIEGTGRAGLQPASIYTAQHAVRTG